MAVEKLIVDHIDTWTTALQIRSTAGRGSSGKIDLYGIKKLRELILELAVRGKLVPQDPNDEPASELLKRIAAEKAELVKQGKIKKPKRLPEISEEGKPFELPAGWAFGRLSTLSTVITKGTTPTSVGLSFTSSGVNFIKVEDISNNKIKRSPNSQFISFESDAILSRSKLESGDILFSIAGTIGKTCLVSDSDLPANTNQALAIIRGTQKVFNAQFILFQLNSFVSQMVKNKARGGAMPNISLGDLNSLCLVIPPATEQIRIIEKLQKLMSLCDQLEQHSLTSLDAHQQLVETLLTTLTDSQNAHELAENWVRISEHFDTLFTTEASIDAFEHTILQLAVTGKLSSQCYNDTNVEETLAIIHETKKDLVKKKLYQKTSVLKSKNMELIFPTYWSHTQLGEICFSIVPNRDKPKKFSGNIPWVTLPDFPDTSLYLNTDVINLGLSPDEIEEFKSKVAPKNSILMSCIGRFGLTAINKHEVVTNQQIHIFVPIGNTSPEFLSYVIRSQKNILEKNSTSTTIAYLNKSNCESIEFGFPPIEEQQRIVQTVNELLNICNILKSGIRKAQQTQLHLADALTDAAIN
ncbi:restriction endonuclease subunit S [Klebsiella spallanzanii]